MKKLTALLLAAVLLFGLNFGGALSSADPGTEKVDVFIGFKNTPGPAEHALVRRFGGEILSSYTVIPSVAARVPQAALPGLMRDPNIMVIEPILEIFPTSSFEAELDNTWGVKRIGVGVVHAASQFGGEINVAVIDSGIDVFHPELKDAYKGGYDFAHKNNDPKDYSGHGTHVSGTVAAARNGTGVVGVSPGVNLYALKVFTDDGQGNYQYVIDALQWITDQRNKSDGVKIQITNNSYGSSGNPGTLVEQAFINTYDAGVLHVSSAGNEGNVPGNRDTVGYPARYQSVMAVAASTKTDARATYSSTGPDVELIAPGSGILSTVPGGGFAAYNGTSMASPHVAGAAAVVWGANPLKTNVQIRNILKSTAEDLGLSANHQGSGLVRVDLASGPSVPVEPVDPVTVAVTGVRIDVKSVTSLTIGNTLQLTATIEPDNATDKSVTWTSSTTAVATVSADGLVTGVAAGDAVITVRTIDGGFTDTLGITVSEALTEPDPGPITDLKVEFTQPTADGLPYAWNSWIDIAVKVTEQASTDQPFTASEGAKVTLTVSIDGTDFTGTTNSEGVFTARYRVANRTTVGEYTITAIAKKEIKDTTAVRTFSVSGR